MPSGRVPKMKRIFLDKPVIRLIDLLLVAVGDAAFCEIVR